MGMSIFRSRSLHLHHRKSVIEMIKWHLSIDLSRIRRENNKSNIVTIRGASTLLTELQSA